MSLQTYRHKRNFKITPEPAGKVQRRQSGGLSFVIQKHAASHLHYDFRLELDGVMLSWAVPKGPSMDPNDKRLAMHVEDHPMAYSDFEGVIPPKQYGAGTVLLWDRGTWFPREDPHAGYQKGRLKFELRGQKLQGGWTLVKSRGGKYGGDNAWLLIKEDDDQAIPANDASIIEDKPRSVVTGRTIEQIATDRDQVWVSTKSVSANLASQRKQPARQQRLDPGALQGAVQIAMPAVLKPQLATLVKALPASGDWIHEIKFDGYRMLCRVESGKTRMMSRNAKDWTADFPDIAHALAGLPVGTAWFDGEVCALDQQGRSSFQQLQNALSRQDDGGLVFYVFDLLYLDGFDLRGAALASRRDLLEALLKHPPANIRFSAGFGVDGEQFHKEACKLGLEGVIAKSSSSTYQEGRSRNWLKLKCGRRQEMVIGGYTDPEGSRTAFGALLLGVYEPDGSLRYSGKVGTGFNETSLGGLHLKLKAMQVEQPAFSNPPRGAAARRSHWVRPELVAEVAFTEWTNEGTLRHPSFQGLRADKDAREVIRERTEADAPPPRKARQAAAPAARKSSIKLSNPDKLLYPDASISKQDLVDFYLEIGSCLLPHLQGRPLALVRCPNGWQQKCFFQKNADATVDPVLERVSVETSDGPAKYMMANRLEAVLALMQMGVLEIHPWGSKSPKLGFPDRMIFDLDPDDSVPWETIVEAARLVNALLEEIGLKGFLKTTGGKGLHVVVPIQPRQPWDVVKGFTKAVAELLVQTAPDRFTARISKSRRAGKIFIDYLRNAEGATAIAAYSIRARANAPVATPIDWNEVKEDVRFDHFNVRNLPARLKKLARDPWADFFTIRQSLTAQAMKKVGYRALGKP